MIPVTASVGPRMHHGHRFKEVLYALHRSDALSRRARMLPGRPHWVVLVGPFAVAAAFGAPGALLIVFSLAFWMDNFALRSAFVTGLVMVVGAVAIALGLLHRVAKIAVTDRRILLTSGVLIKRRAAQWSLHEVDSVEIQQGDLGRMLDYGSIVVYAVGKTAGPFRYASQPFELRRSVEEEIAKAKKPLQKATA